MRVLFQPHGNRPPLAGDVLLEHPDGSATLRLEIPGDAPAIVVAFPGQGEGRWWPDPPSVQPEPQPTWGAVPVLALAPVAPVPRGDLQTCKLCFRRHRDGDYLYCNTCRASGVPTRPAKT